MYEWTEIAELKTVNVLGREFQVHEDVTWITVDDDGAVYGWMYDPLYPDVGPIASPREEGLWLAPVVSIDGVETSINLTVLYLGEIAMHEGVEDSGVLKWEV